MVATTHQNTMVSPAMPQRQMAHPGSDLSVAGALHLAGVRLDSLKREASIGGCAANVWQAKAALCLCLHGSSVPTFCQHGSTCYGNPISLPALSQYDWGILRPAIAGLPDAATAKAPSGPCQATTE